MAVTIKKIGNDTEADRILNSNFISELRSTGFVEVGKDKFVLPALYIDWEEKITKFEVRDDDVYILGHHKTGTTWVQEMVWLIANDLDYEKASKTDCVMRVPLLEYPIYIDTSVTSGEQVGSCKAWDCMTNRPGPRVYKSHLQWSLLPEQIKDGTIKPKIISTLRNPHDTCISYYHHSRLLEGFKGTLEDWAKLFLAGRTLFGPYWKSILSAWDQRHRPNVLFVKYTEMKADLPAVIRKVANFLDKKITKEEIDKLASYLSFDSMKKNPSVNMMNIVNTYAKKFNLNVALWGPFGPYWKQILSVWEQRHRPNVLIVTYTEMKADLPAVIRKVANFLEKPITDEEVDKLANYVSFESMKKNPAVNFTKFVNDYCKRFNLNVAGNEFIRSGKVGGYKEEMPPEMIEQFNQWQKENLAGTDLTF